MKRSHRISCLKATVKPATKLYNLSCKIAVKQIGKQCCKLYHLTSICIPTIVRFDSWVVKCATSLSNNLFCSNVAKQVAQFVARLP